MGLSFQDMLRPAQNNDANPLGSFARGRLQEACPLLHFHLTA